MDTEPPLPPQAGRWRAAREANQREPEPEPEPEPEAELEPEPEAELEPEPEAELEPEPEPEAELEVGARAGRVVGRSRSWSRGEETKERAVEAAKAVWEPARLQAAQRRLALATALLPVSDHGAGPLDQLPVELFEEISLGVQRPRRRSARTRHLTRHAWAQRAAKEFSGDSPIQILSEKVEGIEDAIRGARARRQILWVAWTHPPASGDGYMIEWYAPERKSWTIGRLIEKGKLPVGTVVIGEWGEPAGKNRPPCWRGRRVSGERRGEYKDFKKKLWGSNVHEILLYGGEYGEPEEVVELDLRGEWWVLEMDGSLRMMTKDHREEEWRAMEEEAWAHLAHYRKERSGLRVITMPPFNGLAAIATRWSGRTLPDGPRRANFLYDPDHKYLERQGPLGRGRGIFSGGGDKRKKSKRKKSKRKESRKKSKKRKTKRRRKSKRRKTKRRKSRRCH